MIANQTISDVGITMPTLEQLLKVLFLQEYNTRVVVFGVMALGFASGLIGTFLLLRRRALTADALSHATLPGIAIAFMIMVFFGGTGKFLFGLLLGAFVFGCIGVLAILAIRSTTRLKDDAAIGIVLSVFFGLGVCLLRMATDLPDGSAAGLSSFIFGKAAAMVASDAWLMFFLAIFTVLCTSFLLKEFTVLCFDSGFGLSQGWPMLFLDIVLMAIVAVVTVVALQSVGLVLAVGILIIPAASARFWTTSIHSMLIASAVIGCLSGWLGSVASAIIPRVPTGPVIVLICGLWFLFSFICGPNGGILIKQINKIKLCRRVELQHILRAIWEAYEDTNEREFIVTNITQKRSWTHGKVIQLLKRAEKYGFVEFQINDIWRITDFGIIKSKRVTRNHRLWEVYLINYADVAPSHVDRDADMIEHILGNEMVAKLEVLLNQSSLLESPHPIQGGC